MFVNFFSIKNKEYLIKENSYFFILTNYLNECLCRHCKSPNECPFPGLRGRSLNFSAVKKGFQLGRDAFLNNFSICFPQKLLQWRGKLIFKFYYEIGKNENEITKIPRTVKRRFSYIFLFFFFFQVVKFLRFCVRSVS